MSKQTIIVTSGNVDGDPRGPERRLALLERNREAAEFFVSKSPDKDIVMLILDMTSCELSRAIAKKMQTPEQASWFCKFKAEVEGEGNLASVVGSGPRWQVYKNMQRIQKELHRVDSRNPKVSSAIETLQNPAPPGMAYILVISNGKQLGYLSVP